MIENQDAIPRDTYQLPLAMLTAPKRNETKQRPRPDFSSEGNDTKDLSLEKKIKYKLLKSHSLKKSLM